MSILRRLKIVFHSGSTYDCPFCGYHARSWETVGHDLPVLTEKQVVGGGRRAAGCYQCQSRDRERLLYAYFMEELKIADRKDLSILHIAPEQKLSKLFLKQNFREYICGDLFTKGYEYPDHVQNMNVLDIQYPDHHFDIVICNHVLEHIPEDSKAMSELFRVLKPGGKAVLQVPISKNSLKTVEDLTITDRAQREALFGQFDHVRIYGQDYEQRLRSLGFTINRINISKKYKNMGLNPDEDLFVCEKY